MRDSERLKLAGSLRGRSQALDKKEFHLSAILTPPAEVAFFLTELMGKKVRGQRR